MSDSEALEILPKEARVNPLKLGEVLAAVTVYEPSQGHDILRLPQPLHRRNLSGRAIHDRVREPDPIWITRRFQVSQLLGHSELRVTAYLYAHLQQETAARAARVMDGLLQGVR